MVLIDHLFNDSTVLFDLKIPIKLFDIPVTEQYFPIFAPKITEN